MKIIKEPLKRIIYTEMVNALLRKFLKPFHSIIPATIIKRVPLVGVIDVPLPNSKKMFLKVNGLDEIASRVYWHGYEAFEGETLAVFFNLLKLTNTFLDVGANIGIYTLIGCLTNPSMNVYAFEPNPTIFDCLKENVEINKLNNVQLNCSAITNYDGNITLHLVPGASASTRQGFKKATEAISVPALTLDTFITMNNIQKVDLIKMDTEATEPQVLEGARKLIERDRPIIICEVLHGYTEKALHAVLDDLSYKYFWITDDGLIETEIVGDGTWQYLNYLFVPKNKVPKVLSRINPICLSS